MARSRSVFLYCMAAALHNPALSSLVPRCRLALCRSLHRAENPNLPSVSPFRRMMDDAGRPTEGFTLVAPFLPRRTRFSRNDSPSESREYIFITFAFLRRAKRISIPVLFRFLFYFPKIAFIYHRYHLCRSLGIKIYMYIKDIDSF